eukprot:scaffold18569_cov20-Prasinocladus_malaysianus.AAC.2
MYCTLPCGCSNNCTAIGCTLYWFHVGRQHQQPASQCHVHDTEQPTAKRMMNELRFLVAVMAPLIMHYHARTAVACTFSQCSGQLSNWSWLSIVLGTC